MSGKRKVLSYCAVSAYRPEFPLRKRNRAGILMRQIASYSKLVREFKIHSGEFFIYKNRIRDCEYEVYKVVNLLDKRGWIDKDFHDDVLE